MRGEDIEVQREGHHELKATQGLELGCQSPHPTHCQPSPPTASSLGSFDQNVGLGSGFVCHWVVTGSDGDLVALSRLAIWVSVL